MKNQNCEKKAVGEENKGAIPKKTKSQNCDRNPVGEKNKGAIPKKMKNPNCEKNPVGEKSKGAIPKKMNNQNCERNPKSDSTSSNNQKSPVFTDNTGDRIRNQGVYSKKSAAFVKFLTTSDSIDPKDRWTFQAAYLGDIKIDKSLNLYLEGFAESHGF